MSDANMPATPGLSATNPFSMRSASLEAGWDKTAYSTDIHDLRLTGAVRAPHDFTEHNYVRCLFDSNDINGIHMLHMDFKDCTFVGAMLRAGKIESSAFVNCIFENVTFSHEVFYNCTLQDCRFHNCKFEFSDLGNAFIKGCRISKGSFTNCTSDNHVFEECLFAQVPFTDCDIQIDTILKNYGLKRRLFDQCFIRDKRRREGGHPLPIEALDDAKLPDLDAIARLRLAYFKAGDFRDGADELDTCFNAGAWLRGVHNDFTAGDKVSQFTEFLTTLWEQDEIAFHAILMAHGMTSELVEWLRSLSEEGEYFRVLLSVMGAHMLLARKVERFLFVRNLLEQKAAGKPIVLIVDGPADPDYYKRLLPELFALPDVKIISAKPHNSPSELVVLGVPVIAWFLASLERARFEVATASLRDAETTINELPNTQKTQLLTTRGFAASYQKGGSLEIRAQALLPWSSILIDFDLAVSTKTMAKLRAILVRVLDVRDTDKSGE